MRLDLFNDGGCKLRDGVAVGLLGGKRQRRKRVGRAVKIWVHDSYEREPKKKRDVAPAITFLSQGGI